MGWLVYKFVSPNQRGVPDRMFIKAGQLFFVEFKAPGKKLRPLQQLRCDEIIAAGFSVHIIDDVDLGKALFR